MYSTACIDKDPTKLRPGTHEDHRVAGWALLVVWTSAAFVICCLLFVICFLVVMIFSQTRATAVVVCFGIF